jgi:hypothetical protein
MNADVGDITRTKPEALRVNTSGLAASDDTVILFLLLEKGADLKLHNKKSYW